ncbi:hypothetical protein AB6A40_000427 [Gnathostoma spinigerum]|uniref:Uncharacterized protein n=1 Tax=Gnathostoma spinigerum TaxID=75299 RepID=A0ABD6E251_9BILA
MCFSQAALQMSLRYILQNYSALSNPKWMQTRMCNSSADVDALLTAMYIFDMFLKYAIWSTPCGYDNPVGR